MRAADIFREAVANTHRAEFLEALAAKYTDDRRYKAADLARVYLEMAKACRDIAKARLDRLAAEIREENATTNPDEAGNPPAPITKEMGPRTRN